MLLKRLEWRWSGTRGVGSVVIWWYDSFDPSSVRSSFCLLRVWAIVSRSCLSWSFSSSWQATCDSKAKISTFPFKQLALKNMTIPCCVYIIPCTDQQITPRRSKVQLSTLPVQQHISHCENTFCINAEKSVPIYGYLLIYGPSVTMDNIKQYTYNDFVTMSFQFTFMNM